MAEITYNDLLSKLSGMEKDQFEGVLGSSGFLGNYQKNPDSPLVTGHANYEKFKPIAEAYQASETIPKGNFITNMFNFGSADAAIPDNQYGIMNTDIASQMYTPRQQEIIFGDPNYLGTNTPQYYEGTTVPVANVGELLMNAGTTNFMDQFKTESAVPQMSIEDQIQANIDQIQSTPGFEGYVPSGTPTPVNRPNMRDVAGDINENLIDRGNPYNDPRVVSEEQSLVGGITDRGRGMAAPGEMGAYEMIGGTPVAIGDVLGRQQALEKADFYEPSRKKGIGFNDLLGLAALAYTGPYKGAVKAGSMLNNLRTGRLGKVVDTARGIPSTFAKKMRGVNPVTGRANTQREYEQARANRRRNNRIDYMLDRKAKGKSYSQKNLNELTMGSRPGHYDKPGGDTGGGKSKIVCTMMNERYGFGSFRNKIWMKFHENHGPEYQKGYHTIFLPLVKIAKGEGKINTAVRKVLEHMGRHVTADMFKIMKGKKRDTLGRIYRAIFEPTCRIIGKIKSALGRG